jgi:hypothetical protein
VRSLRTSSSASLCAAFMVSIWHTKQERSIRPAADTCASVHNCSHAADDAGCLLAACQHVPWLLQGEALILIAYGSRPVEGASKQDNNHATSELVVHPPPTTSSLPTEPPTTWSLALLNAMLMCASCGR